MGRIKVNTNLGPVFVNIRGDNPTDEEKELILSKIKELPQSDFTEAPSTAEMDAFQKKKSSLLQEEKKEVVSHDKVMKLLLTAFDMLVKLNEEEAAIEVENTITRLENNSY